MDVDVNDYIEALKLQVAANGDDAAKLKAYAKGLERKIQELEAKLAKRDMSDPDFPPGIEPPKDV